jgi:hypothetical protein
MRHGTPKKTNVARGREFSQAARKTRLCSGKIHCLAAREIINGVSAVTRQAAAQMYFWRRQTHSGVIYSPAAISAKEHTE